MARPKIRLQNVTPVRFLLGILVLACWCALTVLAAGLHNTAVTIIAGVLFTVPLCSLGEWLIHGVLYHAPLPGLEFIQKIHHNGHHFTLFPPSNYVQTSSPYEFMRFRKPFIPFQMADNAFDNFLTKWSQVAIHFVTGIPLIMLPAWLASGDATFTVSVLGTLALISWLLTHVHGVIHTPRNRWIERQSWFQWLDRHHYIHHVDITANINFMLPVCDFLFGTQKWELTAKEAAGYPSFETAKRLAPETLTAATASRPLAARL